ncbi:protein CIP2A homolog L [Plodia interpunctella]|uniref:protein CIP2A homolog L n=1 Tax=Plodia interpunctella TaxID=58824 RepID=UPI002368CB1D|nr:protein CIP2A homolog [Plodia interpunctella]
MMEVDGAENWNNNQADGGKFANLKAFVTAAREFEATHSENAVNLMNRYLGLIASSCDLTIFSPGRSEVCAFFSSLWRVMCDGRSPHWACVAVLSRASIEPSARYALTHTYKFMPILSRLLTDSISNDKKIKVLSVMQDISYGIKISWQESYLPGLMKQLTDWITQPMSEPQQRTIGHKSLTVLVNVCYGNLPAIYALMRTVDTKEFVVHLINLKEGGYGGVETCRLLLCVAGASRGASARQPDVHSYLRCTMRTYKVAVLERDSTQLLHAHTFLSDLCADTNLRGYVLTYPHFSTELKDGLADMDSLCQAVPDDSGDAEQVAGCLRNALKFLTVLVNLDLYALRCHHIQMVCLCMKASRISLPEALELFAAIVQQYKDEGRLPQELISVISDGLPSLLVPPSLEPGKAGLQWLQVLGALCESSETQERLLHEVTPDTFEDTLYNVLQYTSQNGACGVEAAQNAVVVGCRTALSLAPISTDWDAALNRLLAHHQVRKMLCAGLTSGNGQRRRQILQLVKHHYFPSDQMSQVFGESLVTVPEPAETAAAAAGDSVTAACGSVSPQQERAVDQLVARLADALQTGKISDIATSSVMELYGYKMTCLEQRLHSHSVALQGASEHMASLQHSLALLQATNTSQQDVLYTTQMLNERHKQTIDELHKQLEDAETTLRGFRAKIAAERLDKENQRDALQKQHKLHLSNLEIEMKAREKELEDRLRQSESEHKTLQKKLDQQTSKNSELAGVLIKFEERVKQRDKKLEEASETENTLRRELTQKDNMVKQLEKTVAERENRLYQVTSQLEEMKRVQEMVAKLMSKSSNTTAS